MEGSAAPKIENVERRRHSRTNGVFDVDVILFSGAKAGDQIAGRIINISTSGAGIIFKKEIPIGTQLSLTIYSDDDQSVCSGEIIWIKELKGRNVSGVKITQWTNIDPSLEQQLPKPR